MYIASGNHRSGEWAQRRSERGRAENAGGVSRQAVGDGEPRCGAQQGAGGDRGAAAAGLGGGGGRGVGDGGTPAAGRVSDQLRQSTGRHQTSAERAAAARRPRRHTGPLLTH